MSVVSEASANVIETTEDHFLGDRLRMRQPAKGYRAGIDAVLLGAVINTDANGSVLDVGAGVGVVGLCAAIRCPGVKAVLVERSAELAALARENIRSNGLGDRAAVVEADIAAPLTLEATHALPPDTFAHVLANPPFHDDVSGTRAPNPLKAASHAMPVDALEAWARFMVRMTMPGGQATMIHKAEALSRILSVFEGRYGNITVVPVYAREGAPAIRVLVQGTKGSRAQLSVKPGLVLHGDNGNAFRPELDAILRHGEGLQL